MGNINSGWNIKGEWSDDKHVVKINLSVFLFVEDGIHYAYMPALDVLGYGNTEAEAKTSVEISLSEFFRYTHNKNTIILELRRLGWKIRKANKDYLAPAISEQLVSNEQLKEIIDHKQYRTSNVDVSIPAFA
jgi:hypothetical protein